VSVVRRVALTVSVLAACWLVALSATVATGLPPSPPTVNATERALKRLTVTPAGSLTGYSRERFGGGWASTTNGCDVRDRVLIRDGRQIKTGRDCRITGRWRSIYDAKILTAARGVDIDHVVPLAEAWRSGARRWNDTRRERFANDLREPQLIAVSASSNRSKGDSPPQEWKPPRRVVWCLYARWWIDVKSNWKLTVTVAETRALKMMLTTCTR